MKKIVIVFILVAFLFLNACGNKEEEAAARLVFETHFNALIDNDMQTLGNSTAKEYRDKFFSKSDLWSDPQVVKVAEAMSSHFEYEILEVKTVNKNVVILAHFAKPDYRDMEKKVNQAMANTDVQAFANAGYSQAEFDKIMFNRMISMIRRGDFKIKEADLNILMIKEDDGWKVSRDLTPENITDDWF